jgi:hypothetical protein
VRGEEGALAGSEEAQGAARVVEGGKASRWESASPTTGKRVRTRYLHGTVELSKERGERETGGAVGEGGRQRGGDGGRERESGEERGGPQEERAMVAPEVAHWPLPLADVAP